ncbi:molybdopterin molybdotransferase MoeA [Brevibacillus daliensis]|uniref:molybdopterin molybdotransferase MoeA n=1 Tax=Brevibacillus daliensis TaxID=2892995 RepID=UPI001E3A7212|nr:gephyrin-like molybdotransferase Glp [Brevibacillus daliensis]
MNRTHRFKRTSITVTEAQKRVLQHAALLSLSVEEISLEHSLNRRLAETITAGHPVPSFQRAGMDGYAVCCETDVAASPNEPALFQIVGDIAAGMISDQTLKVGEAVRIMTGASVPEGADAVVMFEQTEEITKTQEMRILVKVKHSIRIGQNIAPVGEEIEEGQTLLKAGCIIQPGQMALLATFGYSKVQVYKRPKVGIFATGSELIPIDQPLSYGKIRNSNSYMIQAQVECAGATAYHYGIIPDDMAKTRKILAQALAEMDIVITTGGVSVGDYDIMADYFRMNQEQMLFNRISMRPGSPTSAAYLEQTLLFGLSGNPGACFVGFELLVGPVIRMMLGATKPVVQTITASLEQDYPKGSPHPRYERGKLAVTNGIVSVKAAGVNKSSYMLSIQDADCLILLPSGKTGVKQGDQVEVIPLSYQVT